MTEASPETRLQIRIIPVTPLQQNCSLIWDTATKHAVLVDPGGDVDTLIGALDHFGLTLKEMWLTHGHLDHAGAAHAIREKLGVPVIGPHKDDAVILANIESSATRFGASGMFNCTPDRYLEEGEQVSFGTHIFEVLHCPGHAPGHVVYVNKAAKFAHVGDVLFNGSIGRTDLPGGNHAQLIASIKNKLMPLGDDVSFICGHGPGSTIGNERKSNPYLR